MSTTETPNQYKVRLDDITLERLAGLLPQELREPFIWLGVFTREECAGDVDLLVERFKEVGIYRDKTTWSRILKGQWNLTADGIERPSPLVAKDKLLEEIQCLRNGISLEALKGKVPFIMTSCSRQIFTYIDHKRVPERVNKFGIIIGPTGSQKTATFLEYKRRNNHGLCTWLEAPENGSMGEFVGRLAVAFGGPAREAWARQRRRVFDSLNERKCIIVDNCQRLYRSTRGTDQQVFSFLQRVQDETRCTIILSITPTFEAELLAGMQKGFFEQFEGRAGGRKNFLRLPDFAPVEDVLMIAKAFGLQDSKRHEKFLCEISREPGRIRRLFEDLQNGKLLAEQARKPFTIAYVRIGRDEEEAA